MEPSTQPTEKRQTMNGKQVFVVPSKTVINFESGFGKKLLCDGATFTAGTACPYSCSFCYVPDAMRKQMPYLKEHGVKGKHEDVVIRRANAVETARRQLLNHSKEERARKQVIYASPLTDVAANMELVNETVEICKVILELTIWDIRLLSKSNLLPKIAQGLEDWDFFKTAANSDGKWKFPKNRVIYGVSTGTLDDKLAAAFEGGTPKVSKRIESLHWLQDNGFRTFGMICPSLPQWFPGMTESEAYERFAREQAEAIRWEKCEHVWAEVINVRGDSFARTIQDLTDGGYSAVASELHRMTCDEDMWEAYARATFLGHAAFYEKHNAIEKLRFMQYTTKPTRQWWIKPGVVVL